ncbi:MAG: EamA family transporter [Devosia sp.]
MTLSVFLVVLFAAALHATWNALVKGGEDKLLSTTLICGVSTILAALILPFVPAPAPASWPFIAASTACQVIYFSMVAATYRVADMSEAYPIMRGTAPLLVTIVSVAVLREPLPPLAWLGVLVISMGILGIGLSRGVKPSRGVALALLNAVVIASYTLIDGTGVRHAGSPAGYLLWIFLLTGLPLVGWSAATRWPALVSYARKNWRSGVIGGVGTSASYGLALWAMTLAPVAVVASLRETSILFGVVISGLILKERVSPARIVAACVIAGGAMILRVA